MATGRKTGPRNKVLDHPKRDSIINDMILYRTQQKTGAAEGEDRLSLQTIARKYGIAVGSLQRIEGIVAEKAQQVRLFAEYSGVTQVDVVEGTVRYFQHIQELLGRVRRHSMQSNDYSVEIHVLTTLMPMALDRLQNLVPSSESESLTGRAQEEAKRLERATTPGTTLNLLVGDLMGNRERGSVVLARPVSQEQEGGG